MNAELPPGPVFDFHLRLGPRYDALERLVLAMDGNGITRAVVAAGGVVTLDRLSAQIVNGGYTESPAGNGRVGVNCERSGGRLVPFYFANPHDDAEVYRRMADRFRGLEISPAVHGVGFDDPRIAALMKVASVMGHPVYTVPLGRPGSRTSDLVALARDFPDVTFVLGHCGHIGVDTFSIRLIASQPNIVAETSGCFTLVVKVALDRLGPDRVLFGTEYPLQDPGVELAKYASIGLDAPTWEKVAWRNAHRILGEDIPWPVR